MQSSLKNIAVFPMQCASEKCGIKSCDRAECELCRHCLSTEDLNDLHTAYREHINRGDTKRIFPAPIKVPKPLDFNHDFKNLSKKNQMISRWFAGKCALETTWCT